MWINYGENICETPHVKRHVSRLHCTLNYCIDQQQYGYKVNGHAITHGDDPSLAVEEYAGIAPDAVSVIAATAMIPIPSRDDSFRISERQNMVDWSMCEKTPDTKMVSRDCSNSFAAHTHSSEWTIGSEGSITKTP